MAEPLKNVYNDAFFKQFNAALSKTSPDFNVSSFMADILDDEWEDRELKQRMRHIALTLDKHLPGEYVEKLRTIVDLIDYSEMSSQYELSFEYMFLPDFVEVFGLNDYDASMKAMERITQFTSCEFAVRPFIIKYPDKAMAQMLRWSKHEHHMVRRLASEGSRPRLPWAIALPKFKKDPSEVLPILENLKNDEYEIVRRSVANNLNDIAKDNPEIVIDIVQAWKGESEAVDKLVKHASRTLLKQGEPRVMKIFGFGDVDNIEVSDFEILTPNVQIGQALQFRLRLENKADSSSLVRLEYGIHYLRANGTHSKKVFKISEREYAGNSSEIIDRSQSFKIITTRKFYAGQQFLSVIVNGIEKHKASFELTT